jgi:hypothetical protein
MLKNKKSGGSGTPRVRSLVHWAYGLKVRTSGFHRLFQHFPQGRGAGVRDWPFGTS